MSAGGTFKLAKVSASIGSSTALANEVASLLSESVSDRSSVKQRESRTVNFFFPLNVGGSVYQAHVIGPGIRYATFSWVQTKIDEEAPADEPINLDVVVGLDENAGPPAAKQAIAKQFVLQQLTAGGDKVYIGSRGSFLSRISTCSAQRRYI